MLTPISQPYPDDTGDSNVVFSSFWTLITLCQKTIVFVEGSKMDTNVVDFERFNLREPSRISRGSDEMR
jgi:hypothetical protein